MGSSGFKMHRSASELQVYSRFELGDALGTGGFSTVYKARDIQSGENVAIKVIDKSRYSAKDSTLEREIDIMTKLEHPHIIKLRTVFITEASVFMVLDYAPGGELLGRIGRQVRFPEKQAAYILRQILSATVYLHEQGFVHRDIKLENILLTHRKGLDIKLADFGLSKSFMQEPLETMCGSPQYVSPEVLAMAETKHGVVPPKAYTPAVDIWSTGVVLFMLLSGYSPFDDDEDVKVFRRIRQGKCDVDDPIWTRISDSAKDLVAGMLMVNPKRRLTAKQALAHPWMQYFAKHQPPPPTPPPPDVVYSSRGKDQGRPAAHAIHASSSQEHLPSTKQAQAHCSDTQAGPSSREDAEVDNRDVESEKGGRREAERSKDERPSTSNEPRASKEPPAQSPRSTGGVGMVKAALGKLKLGGHGKDNNKE